MSVRSLRIYEPHGLVRPTRTADGLAYLRPEELARLHQVIALTRWLKLAQIANRARGLTVPLDQLLALQEEELLHRKRAGGCARRGSTSRTARRFPHDFIALIKGSRMPNFELGPEFERLWNKHISADRLNSAHPDWSTDSGLRFRARWLEAIAESERPKDSDPGTPQALDLARRALSVIGEVARYDPELMASLEAICQEAVPIST